MFDANLYSEIFHEETAKLKDSGINDPIRESPQELRKMIEISFNERTTGRKL